VTAIAQNRNTRTALLMALIVAAMIGLAFAQIKANRGISSNAGQGAGPLGKAPDRGHAQPGDVR
jgi:hypothetical protein